MLQCLFKSPDEVFRGGSRAAATSKMERFVIIVNGFLGCRSSPRSASGIYHDHFGTYLKKVLVMDFIFLLYTFQCLKL